MEKNFKFENAGYKISIEICNYERNNRGVLIHYKNDRPEPLSFADFEVSLYNHRTQEIIKYYLQPSFDDDGSVCDLGQTDTVDDFELLPHVFNISDLIIDMNVVLNDYEKNNNIPPFVEDVKKHEGDV